MQTDLEQSQSCCLVILVKSEAMIYSGGKHEQVARGEMDTDPTIGREFYVPLDAPEGIV